MILDTIVEDTIRRIARAKSEQPLSVLAAKASALEKGAFLFEQALRQTEISFICEVKKASPSKGIIAEDFPYMEIAQEYEKAGASAISVLTEPTFFKGAPEYLSDIKTVTSIPLLRKDFTIDPYQIYEAKLLGASAILLICAILSQEQLREYHALADELGLSALVEVHDEREMEKALDAQARIIGVNNRNLNDFTVDISNSLRLRALAPAEMVFVAESGIRTNEDIKALQEAQVDAVLIGETFMRSKNKKQELLKLLRG
ncbi:MAG: indole-3-glycerol phosphate synthase TrpC [Lachnospiraceae bacterium]